MDKYKIEWSIAAKSDLFDLLIFISREIKVRPIVKN
jgi:hypothetical protein